MTIKNLSDRQLIERTKLLVQSEGDMTVKIINHLEEIEKRGLYSKLKFSSIYDYCTKELGYSNAQAWRRVNAMKFARKMPAVKEELEKKNLTLTTVNLLSDYAKDAKLTIADQEDLLKIAEGKTKRELEISLNELRIQQGLEKELTPVTIEKNYTKDLVRLHLTLKNTTVEKLKRVKSYISHSRPKADMELVLNLMSDDMIKKLEVKRFGSANSSNLVADKNVPKENDVTRFIPAPIRRLVYERANGVCQNCKSTYQLEIDHIKSFAQGGTNAVDNLQLLCRKCNQFKAVDTYGKNKMGKYLKSV